MRVIQASTWKRTKSMTINSKSASSFTLSCPRKWGRHFKSVSANLVWLVPGLLIHQLTRSFNLQHWFLRAVATVAWPLRWREVYAGWKSTGVRTWRWWTRLAGLSALLAFPRCPLRSGSRHAAFSELEWKVNKKLSVPLETLKEKKTIIQIVIKEKIVLYKIFF